MNSITILLASLGVLVAAHNGGNGGMGGQGGFGAHGGRGGHGGHPMGPPPPPFLANVTQEGRVAFFKLFQDQNETKAQIKTAVDTWAVTYGVSEQVTAFETEMKSEQEERRANVSTAVGQLADVISELNSIEDAQDLSIAQTREQIRAALDVMTPELRDLVLAATGPVRGEKGPHGGNGGGFPIGGQIGGQGGQFGEMGGHQGGHQGGHGGRSQGRF